MHFHQISNSNLISFMSNKEEKKVNGNKTLFI